MSRGQPRALTPDQLAQVRAWAATPREKRRFTRAGLALRLGVSEHTITRAANERDAYKDTHRVSRGFDALEESCRVKGPQARSLSVASSTGTPEITGAACGSETHYHESRADLRGVTGNAGDVGRGPISP